METANTAELAEASHLKSRVNEILTCPICLDVFENAKMLPCVHSFCLECLRSHCKDKVTGNEVACPVCRKEFQIPDAGLEALPHNFFVHNLIDVGGASSQKPEEVSLEICEAENDADKCEIHCDKHKDERLKLHCHDCEINVCPMCFVVDHKSHHFAHVGKMAKEFIGLFDSHIRSVSSRIGHFHDAVDQVDAEKQKFLNAVDKSETSVQQRCEAVNQITEKHSNRLLEEMRSVKSAGMKEADHRSEELTLSLNSLESLEMNLKELMTKCNCEITREAKAMGSRAAELLKTCVVPISDYRAPCVSFTPTDIEWMRNEERNLIGRITLQTDDSGIILLNFAFGIH